jgi:hypothetical protein
MRGKKRMCAGVYELRRIDGCDKNFRSDVCGSIGFLNRSGGNVFSRAVGAPTRYATPRI